MLILLILLSHNCSLNDDDGFGATALYCAANKEKVQMVRVLLQNGANPNTKTRVYIDGPGAKTPLHVASPSREIMQLLLDHGADAAAKDDQGRTPADWLRLHDDRGFDLVETKDGWRIRPRDNMRAKKLKDSQK